MNPRPAARRRIRPRKLPQQERARATVEVILEAAARILVKHGFDGMTTNHVAEKAGVSVGSLYQYFPNKESLVAELERRHHAELRAAFEEAYPRAEVLGIAEMVDVMIRATIRAHTINPELHRVLSDEIPRLGPVPEFKAFEQEVYARLKAMLERRRDELTVPDLGLASYLVLRTVEAAVHDSLIRQGANTNTDLLGAELSRMITLYLTGVPVRATLGRAA